MKIKYPKYLYHYTSIDNLALILKNRTIRFNSLVNVDDPTEIKTLDTDGIGKYCYCSCWTDKKESIPFWSMYTKDMHGVMIKMVSFPFDKHKEFLPYFDGGKEVDTYIPEYIFRPNNVYAIVTIPFLRRVNYIKNPNVKIFNWVERNFDGTFNSEFCMDKIGLYKTLSWNFQSEWRYSMVLIPHDIFGGIKIDVSNSSKGLVKPYYDIKISDEALKSMEIITGPKMNIGEKILVESICKIYMPNLKISESKLKIR